MATKTCKNEACDALGEEASGYCFVCAEEMACLLAEAGFDPAEAWR